MRRVYFLFLLFFPVLVLGQTIPDRPNPPRLVNDFAGILSQTDIGALEEELRAFDNETSTQISVVVINDLGGTDISDFAFKLGEKWGVGSQGRNNGIVMIVKPKTSDSRGGAFIATGYGLEGAVTDAVSRRIVDNEMIPFFKENNYAEGIRAGTQVLMKLTRGEFTAEGYLNQDDDGALLGAGIMFVIFLVIIIIGASSKASEVQKSSIGKDIPFWVAMSMMANASNKNRGSWGNFTGNSGGFGGSGSSFRGFGGGSFGGGGGGGSW